MTAFEVYQMKAIADEFATMVNLPLPEWGKHPAADEYVILILFLAYQHGRVDERMKK